jgi:hypothetical protein
MNRRIWAKPGKNNWRRAIQEIKDDVALVNLLLNRMLDNPGDDRARTIANISLANNRIRQHVGEIEEIGLRAKEILDTVGSNNR